MGEWEGKGAGGAESKKDGERIVVSKKILREGSFRMLTLFFLGREVVAVGKPYVSLLIPMCFHCPFYTKLSLNLDLL